jgi:hypothetical protein
MIPSGIEHATFRLVAQFTNQMRHRVRPRISVWYSLFTADLKQYICLTPHLVLVWWAVLDTDVFLLQYAETLRTYIGGMISFGFMCGHINPFAEITFCSV